MAGWQTCYLPARPLNWAVHGCASGIKCFQRVFICDRAGSTEPGAGQISSCSQWAVGNTPVTGVPAMIAFCCT